MTDILIVDDDATFGELTLQRIEIMGWDVAFHLGPFGTINAIRAAKPRLLIMDVNMPGLEGTSIHGLLRKRGELMETKVLLVSSIDQKELDRLAAENGIDAALHKAASKTQLRTTIELLIGVPRR
jgi:DNA-binding response OmpR family regulator